MFSSVSPFESLEIIKFYEEVRSLFTLGFLPSSYVFLKYSIPLSKSSLDPKEIIASYIGFCTLHAKSILKLY